MKRQKSFATTALNALYLVATPIGNLEEMTPRAIEILKTADVIAAEDTRNTLRLLTHFGIHTKMIAHHRHNEQASTQGILKLLEQGKTIALVSDAGYPLISDPGQVLSEQVLAAGYPIIPVSGANAMLNALVASGLPTQPFLFYGFLKPQEREQTRELEQLKDYPMTLIFYEAPHRLTQTLYQLRNVLGERRICLARELTKYHEEFIRGTISEVIEVSDTCKGEIVLVVEGAKKEDVISIDPATLYAKIEHYVEEGISHKEAIKRVAKEYGLAKNDVYRQYHAYH